MRSGRKVPPGAFAKAIEKAKSLVAGHCDAAVPPAERLNQIAKKLKVARVQAADVDGDGFLGEDADGNVAVYYDVNGMPERRRFTVAHELAHLILNKYHRHLDLGGSRAPLARRTDRGNGTSREGEPLNTSSRTRLAPHSYALEKAVDAIAAELLMPEALVIPVMRDVCHVARRDSLTGVIDKRKVVCAVREVLGVSEWALVLRLREMRELLAVQFEFQWPKEPMFGGACRLGSWTSLGMEIRSYPYPTREALEGKDGWALPVRVRTQWGERTIRCQAWRRPPSNTGSQVTWVVGWTWNCFPIPKWDDAQE